VVAKVNGAPIYLSDLQAAAQGLPDNLRGLPPQMLFPMILDQLIDGRALVIEARKDGLDKDPLVARQMTMAEDRALQSAMLSKVVGPTVTDEALKARFDKDNAGKPGEEEVRASHILVANEADAKKIIAELDGGADFATLAKQNSTDPGGKTGGDLGFFKKDDMVPEFAAAAFALKPGEITQTPVHTQFGWHVIKLEERRTAPPPTFEQSRDELRQKMIQEGVQKAVAQARTGLTVQKFNMDGTPMKPTDTAEPPPAPKP
jgi:peptidyl-prolyl cis-trans isomerase C